MRIPPRQINILDELSVSDDGCIALHLHDQIVVVCFLGESIMVRMWPIPPKHFLAVGREQGVIDTCLYRVHIPVSGPCQPRLPERCFGAVYATISRTRRTLLISLPASTSPAKSTHMYDVGQTPKHVSRLPSLMSSLCGAVTFRCMSILRKVSWPIDRCTRSQSLLELRVESHHHLCFDLTVL